MMRVSLIIVFAFALMTSCVRKPKENVQPIDTASLVNQHQVKVTEVLQAREYTYLNVDEDGDDYWVAVSKMDAKPGDNYYFREAMTMKNFKSKDLDREFETVLFISDFRDVPFTDDKESMPDMEAMSPHGHSGKKAVKMADDVQVDPVDGGVTIAQLYKDKKDYEGEKVTVRGKVVKVNKQIMNRNWVHLQDGTNDNGHYDLAVTTQADVNVGDVVTLEGTVTLDKDFGAGYFYDLIVEEAEQK